MKIYIISTNTNVGSIKVNGREAVGPTPEYNRYGQLENIVCKGYVSLDELNNTIENGGKALVTIQAEKKTKRTTAVLMNEISGSIDPNDLTDPGIVNDTNGGEFRYLVTHEYDISDLLDPNVDYIEVLFDIIAEDGITKASDIAPHVLRIYLEPIKINSAEDFQLISSSSNHLKAKYIIENDIDMSGISLDPIGSETEPFTGVIDGQGYRISGLNITSGKTANDGKSYSALFAVNEGTIKNIMVSIATIGDTSIHNAAVIAGINKGTIEQVGVTGSTITADEAAGLVSVNNGTLINSFVKPTLNGVSKSSGVVTYNNGTIQYVYSRSSIKSGSEKSTVAYDTAGGTISNTYAMTVTDAYFVFTDSTIASSNDNGQPTMTKFKLQSTYKGWDFDNIWYMPGSDSPQLQVARHETSV